MKNGSWKWACALACAGALPQLAEAQSSSVTLYGIMDVGLQLTSAGGLGSVTGVSNGGYATSRLGFRGREDLGSGWSAGFVLEGSLNPDTGTGRASNTNNQASGAQSTTSLTFDRQSYVSLAGPMGEVRLGHDFAPTHWNNIYFDPFNQNGVARAGNLTFAAVGSGSLYTTTVVSNAVSYWLPKDLGGWYGMAMVGFGENGSGSPQKNDGNFAGGRLGYAQGALDVAAGISRTRYARTATIGDYTHANIGASYNLGVAKLFALYNQVDVDLSGGKVRKRSYELGAHIPVSTQGKVRLSYAMLNDGSSGGLLNTDGSARSANDARQVGIGYVHDLSKRTALYGTYAHIRNRGQASYAVSGGRSPLAGRNSSGLEIGLRHMF